jgi:hypothetical protein
MPCPSPCRGTHNLVVGAWHNWTSVGGLVAGEANSIFGPSASISGGTRNAAVGRGSAISGGAFNRAFGNWSTVGGGHEVEENDTFGWEAD